MDLLQQFSEYNNYRDSDRVFLAGVNDYYKKIELLNIKQTFPLDITMT